MHINYAINTPSRSYLFFAASQKLDTMRLSGDQREGRAVAGQPTQPAGGESKGEHFEIPSNRKSN